MINYKVAAAVSAALGLSALGGVAEATPPTYAACQAIEATGGNSTNKLLFMAGSSAAQNGFSLSIGNDYFGGVTNLTIIKTGGNLNFQAYCGVTTASNTAFGGPNVNVLVYYRAEGGSVTGLLPIAAQANGSANGKIQTLKLAGVPAGDVSCATAAGAPNTCTITANTAITGTSSANGPTDSYGGTGLQSKYVDIGVTDVEPGQFGPGAYYPTAYSATVYGSMTALNITHVPQTLGFQQAFGLFVNPTNLNTTGGTIDISQATVESILNGTYTDWSEVPLDGGGVAATNPQAIYWINRENGSGSKASTGIYYLSYGCGGKTALPVTGNPVNGANGNTDGWSTKEVLLEVSTQAGGLTYASIDNAGSVGNTALVTLNGVAPTNLLSATSSYPFLFESHYTFNNAGNNQDGQGTAANVWNNAIIGAGEFVNVGSAPHSAQVSAIGAAGVPGNAQSPNVLGSANTLAGHTIYIGAFTRNGNSCSALLPNT